LINYYFSNLEDDIINEDDEIREMTMQTDAFDFWNDVRIDLYQDFLQEKPLEIN
jgi:hypothetical protein